MASTTQMFFASLIAITCVAFGRAFCPLCARPGDLPKRFNYQIADGRTCRDLYVELGGMQLGDPRCQATKDIAEEACCSEEEPGIVFIPSPTDPPVYSGPIGSEPNCPICITPEYPGIPGAFIVARYVGEFSCDQLYGRGLNGLIPNFMCGPLQDFAQTVCGCGDFNPRCQADPSQCFGAPPAIRPTPRPTNRPTAQPVPPPTLQPVTIPTNPPVTSPVAAPFVLQPTIFDRKIPPKGGKYTQKLSGGRGGAAAALRGGRRTEEKKRSLGEVDFNFQVIEKEV